MSPDEVNELVLLRRARDFMDRNYQDRLSVPVLAERAAMSPAHFSRRFRAVYGETPYAYLMTRRIERAMMLLRGGATVTDACFAVGCVSLGSFSSSFRDIVGVSPSEYRERDHGELASLPPCVAKRATRPLRTAVSR
ncbi:MAG: helix-turn-helix transcriptional regulator [Ilumatobacter sp.]|uniref:helix-turn-helix transcriptional regulator n=1 Tax=Ilumatobacter sp. TaxID=1967498 RepID=UPI00329857F7